MSIKIDLAAFPNQAVDYANYEDLDTKRHGVPVCPHCYVDLYLSNEQKEYFCDNAYMEETGNRKPYPCTCPNCGAEINLVIDYQIVPWFDIEGC